MQILERERGREREMGHSSLPRSPKKEEQEVPDSTILQLSEIEIACSEKEIRAVDNLEAFWGIENEDNLPEKGKSMCAQLTWDFMDWEGLSVGGEEEESDKKAQKTSAICEDESHCSSVKRGNYYYGFWDEEYEAERKASLNLNLNYQQVLDAWSDRGSLWADEYSLSIANNSYMGEVPVMEEERTRREASVLRYKEKRQARLFSKKIRYHVRKLNADKRPRLKGRFVRRSALRNL